MQRNAVSEHVQKRTGWSERERDIGKTKKTKKKRAENDT